MVRGEVKKLLLGGIENFIHYRNRFRELYQSKPIFDVLGRKVVFQENACKHVCFKTAEPERFQQLPRDSWSQERAERIPWIRLALTEPEEVRPSHVNPTNQAYFVTVSSSSESTVSDECFLVLVKPLGEWVEFVSAFPIDQAYRAQVKRSGPRIYPAPAPQKAGRGRGRKRGREKA